MLNLDQSLAIILEDGPLPERLPLDQASALVREMHAAQQRILDIQHSLGKVKRQLAGDLALAIRRAMPGLNLGVDKDSCRVGYKTKSLALTPDFTQEMWKVTSHNDRFMREFVTRHRRELFLTSDPSQLVTAITAHFTAYFRTLGEAVEGTGCVLVDGHKATLVDLVQWRTIEEALHKPLMSRSTRRAVYA